MVALTHSEIVFNTTRWPINSVPYSQVYAASPTKHRQDCSGYGYMCLGYPPPGGNTITMVTMGHVRRIEWWEVIPGDIIGKLGIGTGGNAGHVRIVIAINPDRTSFVVMEQAIGSVGPDRSVYSRNNLIANGYLPYRSTAIKTIAEDDEMAKYVREQNGSVYREDGTDPATGYPILWPVRNPDAWVEYQRNGHSATEIDAVDWNFYRNGEQLSLPGSPIINIDINAIADAVANKLSNRLAQ